MYPKPNFLLNKRGYIAILSFPSKDYLIVDYFKIDPNARLIEKPNQFIIEFCWPIFDVPMLREELRKFLLIEAQESSEGDKFINTYKKDLFSLPRSIRKFLRGHKRSNEVQGFDALLLIERKKMILENLLADYRDRHEEFYEIYLKKYPPFFNKIDSTLTEDLTAHTMFWMPFVSHPLFLLGSLAKHKYDTANGGDSKQDKYKKESLKAWLKFARDLTVAEKNVHKKIASIFEQAEKHNMLEHLMYELKDYDHSHINSKFEEVRQKYPKKENYYPYILVNSSDFRGQLSVFFDDTLLVIFRELGLLGNLKETLYYYDKVSKQTVYMEQKGEDHKYRPINKTSRKIVNKHRQ